MLFGEFMSSPIPPPGPSSNTSYLSEKTQEKKRKREAPAPSSEESSHASLFPHASHTEKIQAVRLEEINRAKKIRPTLSQELQNQQNEESAAVSSTLPSHPPQLTYLQPPPPQQPHYYSQGILPLPSHLPSAPLQERNLPPLPSSYPLTPPPQPTYIQPPPPQPPYYSQGILPLPSYPPTLFPPWHTQMHPSQPSNIYPQPTSPAAPSHLPTAYQPLFPPPVSTNLPAGLLPLPSLTATSPFQSLPRGLSQPTARSPFLPACQSLIPPPISQNFPPGMLPSSSAATLPISPSISRPLPFPGLQLSASISLENIELTNIEEDVTGNKWFTVFPSSSMRDTQRIGSGKVLSTEGGANLVEQLKIHTQSRLEIFTYLCEYCQTPDFKAKNVKIAKTITKALHYFYPADTPSPLPQGKVKAHISIIPRFNVMKERYKNEFVDKQLYQKLNSVDIVDEVINEIDAEEEVEGRTLALDLLSQVAEGTLTPFEATSHLKDHILKIFERIKNGQFKWEGWTKEANIAKRRDRGDGWDPIRQRATATQIVKDFLELGYAESI
ncbi:hypothetical protein NEOC65_000352 [Neochlamydia sp. AcF65]|nr:hypothetical protein [Neochlamydia sp. AcF65]